MPKLDLAHNGVKIRMYRHGHGDCYLLAFPREGGGEPVYVLIDCGYKPGSPAFLEEGRKIDEIVDQIGEATGHRLDLVIVTHEHQDHLNGFWKSIDPYFGPFEIQEAWLAWTENPADTLANQLREQHGDVLVGLAQARNRLALAAGEGDPGVARVDSLLALELGGEVEGLPAAAFLAAASNPEGSVNKQALKLIKDKAREHDGVQYLVPGEPPRAVPGSAGVRVFVLGPPRRADLLSDEDPVGEEAFPRGPGGAHPFSFRAAAAGGEGGAARPFAKRHCIAHPPDPTQPDPFFAQHYGHGDNGVDDEPGIEVPDDAAWRRIDDEWLYSAESLALKLNEGINNTSLVLAFELPATKKILLFVGDAQRGNWISWTEHKWEEGGRTIDARDLLARTVLYKVGHHGSHNATLAGKLEADYPNLSWMGQGEAARELTAMINAVNAWAIQVKPKPWIHPLPSIRQALLQKTQGRVLQMDIDQPNRPDDVPEEVWASFLERASFERLWFDYSVFDE